MRTTGSMERNAFGIGSLEGPVVAIWRRRSRVVVPDTPAELFDRTLADR
jgi:hypothetical protein